MKKILNRVMQRLQRYKFALIRRRQKYIQEKKWWYRIIYLSGCLYIKLLNTFPVETHKNNLSTENTNGKKKIVIIYSKRHFDPSNDSNIRLYSQTVTGMLAKNIYMACEGDDVTYVDQHEPILNIRDADIIIGITSKSFVKYCKQNKKAKKILFLVNAHPLERIHALIHEAKKYKKNIPYVEYMSPFIAINCLHHASHLAGAGNDFVVDTFKNYGVTKKEIIPLNWGVDLEKFIPYETLLPASKIRVLYSASYLGLRKGLFRTLFLWEKMNEMLDSDKIELIIMGSTTGEFEKDIDIFVKKYRNVEFKGWIDSSKEEYVHLLQSSHIIINFSIEEGQVGAVLEAMATNAVPIITVESGIPIKNNRDGFLITSYNENQVKDILLQLIRDREMLFSYRKSARIYIERNHTWPQFKDGIQKIIYNK